MERLTIKNWRNLGPWETCGQDNYCKRGCHEQGGCAKGCIVPRIYARLAVYEDTGLEPENMAHWMDYFRAECEGRLVVLPCGTDVNLVRDGHTYKADHWNHTLTAFRDAPENKSGMQVALFSIKEAEEALKGGEG